MAEIPGVKITGRLVPTDTTDTYSATSELYHHGGYKSVADETERLSITSDRRKEGMLVYQLDTKKFWTLEGGILDANWIEIDVGGSGPDITETFGLTKTNYLKTSNLLDTDVWTQNFVDPITVTETTEDIAVTSCIDTKWYKFSATGEFTASVPYHISQQFKTGKNAKYTLNVVMSGSFEAYDWSFDIYNTSNVLVHHFDINHNNQQIQTVTLDPLTDYIFGIQYSQHGAGAPPMFYVGDVSLYEAEGQSLSHNDIQNRDVAGNHSKIVPATDSTTAVQITKADGTTPVVVTDTTNTRLGIGVTPTARLHVEEASASMYEQRRLAKFGIDFPGVDPSKNIEIFAKMWDDASDAAMYIAPCWEGQDNNTEPYIKFDGGTVCFGNGIYSSNYDEDGINFSSSSIQNISNVPFLFGQGVQYPYTITAGSVTLNATHYFVECSSTSTAQTISLPAVSSLNRGQVYVIKRTGTANVTITAYSGQTIDGSANIILSTQYDSVSLISNGSSKWSIF